MRIVAGEMTRARDLNPVRLCREQRGMLLVELAREISRSAAMLSMIEGGFYPRVQTQQAIASALDATREDLFPMEFA